MSNHRLIYTVTRRYLWQNRKRSLISLLGILLMTMLMTCVFVGKNTLLAHLTQSAESEYGKWDLVAYGVSDKTYQKLLKEVSPKEVALTTDNFYSDFEQTDNPDRPFINLRRYNSAAFDWHNIKVTSGRLPQKENEIVLSQKVLDEGGQIAIGDTISAKTFRRYMDNQGQGNLIFPFIELVLPANTKTELPRNFAYFGNDPTFPKEYVEIHESTGFESDYEVVGFITPSAEEAGASYSALAYLPENQFPTQDIEVNISLNLEDTTKVQVLSGLLREWGVENLEVNNAVLTLSGLSTDSTINGIVIFAQIFFTVLIAGVSIILIYNLFNLSYDERLNYLSLLSSVGATSKQRRASVYYEAFLLVLIALPFGVLTGLGVIFLALQMIAPRLLSLFQVSENISLHLIVTWQSVFWIVLATAITVFLAAYLPARKIAKLVPIEGLRSHFSKKKARKIKASKEMQVESLLAKGFLRYQKTKGNSIVRALAAFISVLLITGYGAQAILSAFKYKTVDTLTTVRGSGDREYYLTSFQEGNHLTGQMLAELEKTDGISNIQVIYESRWSGELTKDQMTDEYHQAAYQTLKEYFDENWSYENYWKKFPESERNYFMSLIAFDDEIFSDIVKAVGGKWDKSQDYPIVIYQNGEISTETNSIWQQKPRSYKFFETEQMVKAELGQELPVSFVTGVEEEKAVRELIPMTVAGLGNKETLAPWLTVHDSFVWAIMPRSAFEKLDEVSNGNLGYDRSISFDIDEDSETAMRVVNLLKQLNNEKVFFGKRELTTSKNYIENLSQVVTIVMVSFVVLTSLICLLNLYNALAGLMVTRRQNFVILRSLGMTNRQLMTMIRREMYVLFAKSLVIGGVVSGLACWLVNLGIVHRFGYFKIVLPAYFWWTILICYALVLILVQYLTVRENNRSLIDDIRKGAV